MNTFINVALASARMWHCYGFHLYRDDALHQALLPLARQLAGYEELGPDRRWRGTPPLATGPLGGHNPSVTELVRAAVEVGMDHEEVCQAIRAIWPAYLAEQRACMLAWARLGPVLSGSPVWDALDPWAVGAQREESLRSEVADWAPPCPV